MTKKKKKNKKEERENNKNFSRFLNTGLPEQAKKWILGVVIFILAIIVALSFFNLAGIAGSWIMQGLTFLIGKAVFLMPLIFAIGGIVFFKTHYEKFFIPAALAIFILIIGTAGILESFNYAEKQGGFLGYIFAWPFIKLFGNLVSTIIFGGIILIGGLILWHLIRRPRSKEEEKTSLIKKIFAPKFKVKEIEPRIKESSQKAEEPVLDLKSKAISPFAKSLFSEYKLPPLELLETEKGKPAAGDTMTNSAIIKKTLENFGVGVEMSEINIGPAVTQYTLKPAEGVNLSKITALSNNLSLALASHPIRIEAPIPGKSLVGIEIPNRERCKVRLRDLLSAPQFQNSVSSLTIALGKDVSGNPCYADLARMPHLLVAGSTGTGKTIFLNNLVLSLLYQNSPEILRLILIDPKRVEFSAYKELPHLLCPVIFDAQKSVNVLKWLIGEMERRFDVLSGNGSRDMTSYNEKVIKEGEEPLSYIVLIIDELADLMAAKGREMEVGVVRLAQMARAVGIHLVVATQRPSVEVITGLIKANITSRVTFQVASQVDSRTVLDMAGAEKLLGLGDLLFISAEVAKPKRIQGAYVSEKEIRKSVDFINSQNVKIKTEKAEEGTIPENHLAHDLEKTLEGTENRAGWNEGFGGGGEDPLYEEAKKIVIETKKASASFLQRRLRIGYARAARMLDVLEERGVVGPGEGAKPREVYLPGGSAENISQQMHLDESSEDEGWKKL